MRENVINHIKKSSGIEPIKAWNGDGFVKNHPTYEFKFLHYKIYFCQTDFKTNKDLSFESMVSVLISWFDGENKKFTTTQVNEEFLLNIENPILHLTSYSNKDTGTILN